MISCSIKHPVLDLLKETLLGSKFEETELVGGVIRDAMLGLPSSDDLDFVTTESSEELANFLFSKGVCDYEPVLYPRFLTSQVGMLGHKVEFVTARSESYDFSSRKPEVVGSSLMEDTFRRDFTINTLSKTLYSDGVIDRTGVGIRDIQEGLIDTPCDPDKTFIDDPLRMLRAARFHAKFQDKGFDLSKRVAESIRKNKDRLNIVSGERVREEIAKVAPYKMKEFSKLAFVELELFSDFFAGHWLTKDIQDENWLIPFSIFLWPFSGSIFLRKFLDWLKLSNLERSLLENLFVCYNITASNGGFKSREIYERGRLEFLPLLVRAIPLFCKEYGYGDFNLQEGLKYYPPKFELDGQDIMDNLGVEQGPWLGYIIKKLKWELVFSFNGEDRRFDNYEDWKWFMLNYTRLKLPSWRLEYDDKTKS